jgi:hypothetical protein
LPLPIDTRRVSVHGLEALMLLFIVNPSTEHELYLKLFITCGGGL